MAEPRFKGKNEKQHRLLVACSQGEVSFVRKHLHIVDQVRDELYGHSALTLAMQCQQAEVVDLLLSRIYLEVRGLGEKAAAASSLATTCLHDGSRPVHVACEHFPSVLHTLARCKVDFSVRGAHGRTPLHLLAMNPRTSVESVGTVLASVALQHGERKVPPFVMAADGRLQLTAIQYAARANNGPVLAVLVRALGANLGTAETENTAPLADAFLSCCSNDFGDGVKCLVQKLGENLPLSIGVDAAVSTGSFCALSSMLATKHSAIPRLALKQHVAANKDKDPALADALKGLLETRRTQTAAAASTTVVSKSADSTTAGDDKSSSTRRHRRHRKKQSSSTKEEEPVNEDENVHWVKPIEDASELVSFADVLAKMNVK